VPRLLAPFAPSSPSRDGVRGHVLDHSIISCGCAADVARDVGVGASWSTRSMNSWVPKLLSSDDTAPVGVDHRRALVARSDAVLPVVLVGEAAAASAGPGRSALSGRRRRRCGCRACSGPGARSDPDPFVDAAAEVLGEVAVDVLVHGGARLVGAQDRARRGPADGAGACACPVGTARTRAPRSTDVLSAIVFMSVNSLESLPEQPRREVLQIASPGLPLVVVPGDSQ